jgi:hypothetical protein
MKIQSEQSPSQIHPGKSISKKMVQGEEKEDDGGPIMLHALLMLWFKWSGEWKE